MLSSRRDEVVTVLEGRLPVPGPGDIILCHEEVPEGLPVRSVLGDVHPGPRWLHSAVDHALNAPFWINMWRKSPRVALSSHARLLSFPPLEVPPLEDLPRGPALARYVPP